MKKIQSVRGMNDILPADTQNWSYVERILQKMAIKYGYKEIRFPFLESTELFSRAIGEATDIVEKEMYTFSDRNGDSLTLRPEGTASCIRAGVEHGLFYNQVQRLFYYGPMFRHERPQKGRYRQFNQFGIEAYGLSGPDIDVEIMLLANSIWKEFKIDGELELQINSLGTSDTREVYRADLVNYFEKNSSALDEDSKRRLVTNPLRILDSKNPDLNELIDGAPKLLDYLDGESGLHFEQLCELLDGAGVPYVVNPRLVRGLDYYCHTVFEWVPKATDGAQSVVCAGGHYDGLVAKMGGKPTPAIGFALGLERLVSMVSDKLKIQDNKLIYIVILGDKVKNEGICIGEKIRANTDLNVIVNCAGGSLSTQLKRADKSGAELAIIIGDNELAKREVLVKNLREEIPQQSINIDDLETFLMRGDS